jgi:hypothetical protein
MKLAAVVGIVLALTFEAQAADDVTRPPYQTDMAAAELARLSSSAPTRPQARCWPSACQLARPALLQRETAMTDRDDAREDTLACVNEALRCVHDSSDALRAIAVAARLLVGQLDEVEQALLAARQTIGRADQ